MIGANLHLKRRVVGEQRCFRNSGRELSFLLAFFLLSRKETKMSACARMRSCESLAKRERECF